jgi:hypothetical protein
MTSGKLINTRLQEPELAKLHLQAQKEGTTPYKILRKLALEYINQSSQIAA